MSLDESILRKINKCLALAASDVPGEAEAAMRQAQKLMERHGVTLNTLEASKIKSVWARGTAGQKPPAWEITLVRLCCDAFGGKALWTTGPKGGKGDWANGWWSFLAGGGRAELIQYAYTTLVRQALKAREKHSEEVKRERWWMISTRPEKGEYLNNYLAGYVIRLKKKVAPYALAQIERDALDSEVKRLTNGGPPAKGRDEELNARALQRGYEDGADATFHAAAKGPAEQLKLGGQA